MTRTAFTMIELIFVIVILGILAAVAIPKLAATRDDAKVAAEMTNIAQVIQNLAAEWTAKGAFTATSIADADAASKCFTIAAQGAEGNITVAVSAVSTECPATTRTPVLAKAVAYGITEAAGAAKTYVLGGTSIVQ